MSSVEQHPEQRMAVPDYIDAARDSVPRSTFAIVPRSPSNVSEGWNHVTFEDVARAVDKMAHWIETTCGIAEQIGQTFGYMGANDLRYFVVFAASMKTGYIPLFTSPRNSLDGQISLVENTACTVFLTTSDTKTAVEAIQKAVPGLKVYCVPTSDEVFDYNQPIKRYPGRHRRDATAPTLILHTSGSTGLPKPIRLTVGGLNTMYAHGQLGPENGTERVCKILFTDPRPLIAPVPFFHAMGILIGLRPIMFWNPIVQLPAGKLLSADLVIDVIESVHPKLGQFSPSIIEDMAATERGLQALSKLDHLFFGGAPLAEEIGDKVCRLTKLTNTIGSTEVFMMDVLLPSVPEEWAFFNFGSASNVIMEAAEDDTYEMVIKPKDIKYQAIFYTFPGIQEWRTKDLFKRHPSKPHLWKYSGRRDDVIVLSNGEKFNPVQMEKTIESHPRIKGALVVGHGKFQAGLLIEPNAMQDANTDIPTLIDEIWPIVEKANQYAPGHARIYRSKVAVVSDQKAFIRAAKGSTVRQRTVEAFDEEIEAMYADEGYVSDPSQDTFSLSDMKTKINAIFSCSLPSFHENTTNDTDIFSLGVDSLDVLTLTKALKKAVPGANINLSTIYKNPTVNRLATALSQGTHSSDAVLAEPLTREEKLAAMVRKYTKGMVRPSWTNKAPPVKRPSKQTFILTGSTGGLGTHIIAQLLKNQDVEKIYCLNRSENAYDRQKEALTKYHNAEADLSKAEFLKTDFSIEKFGLSDESYARLLEEATVFIHNAWAVDFNLSLESYEETHIAGTCRTVNFALESHHDAPIVFISSIASVANWGNIAQDRSGVPESVTTLFDGSLTLPQGYAESKFVAAQILATASHRLGIRTAIVRAGQLAGPSTDAGGAAWNKREWLPTIVHTSKIFKKLPRNLGNMEQVDWVCMDTAAGTVIDIATATSSGHEATEVYNLVNPHTTTWSRLYPVIQTSLQETGVDVEIVDYDDWLNELASIPQTRENAERVPGLKLLDFYEGMRPDTGIGLPKLDTRRAEAVSRMLRDGQGIDEAVMRKWMTQWAF
ncbi:uncharacterized protein yc1106_02956 [Curvularia clavata]|uniref:Carrier domain-containing protein n=1 Tax=Curvularia clavata TaxID=95742 RepID=A0A9Q9DQK1_CURCL|nr:uncharacterized protein yc1106_02956 [Curvularia clavata]